MKWNRQLYFQTFAGYICSSIDFVIKIILPLAIDEWNENDEICALLGSCTKTPAEGTHVPVRMDMISQMMQKHVKVCYLFS